MATIPNITIPANTLFDFYADATVVAAGINPQDAVNIKLESSGNLKINESLDGSTIETAYRSIDSRDLVAEITPSGTDRIWLYATPEPVVINVEAV